MAGFYTRLHSAHGQAFVALLKESSIEAKVRWYGKVIFVHPEENQGISLRQIVALSEIRVRFSTDRNRNFSGLAKRIKELEELGNKAIAKKNPFARLAHKVYKFAYPNSYNELETEIARKPFATLGQKMLFDKLCQIP